MQQLDRLLHRGTQRTHPARTAQRLVPYALCVALPLALLLGLLLGPRQAQADTVTQFSVFV